jgi:prepilin-type N-terminal cleavage/methylation domain-containing protein
MQSEQSTLDGSSRRSRPAAGCARGRAAAHCLYLGHQRRAHTGVTLIELLCVITIIAILAALLLPTVSRVYNRIKGTADELEAPDVADMLLKETRDYCAAHPQYQFDCKSDFAEKCRLAPKPRNWVQAPSTEFVPFDYLDPTNKTVLSVHLGPRRATLYAFTKGNLSVFPPER